MNLECHSFKNNHILYLSFIVIGSVLIMGSSVVYSPLLLSDSFFTMLMYLWSKLNRNIVVLLFGICPIPASYLCWVIIGIKCLNKSNSIIADLQGIVVSQLYYSLSFYLRNTDNPFFKSIGIPSFMYCY